MGEKEVSDRETMDTSVTASTVKPSGQTVPNGTPGKVEGYGVQNAPFESVGIDSGEDGQSYFPQDQNKGFVPGSGKTQNNPNS